MPLRKIDFMSSVLALAEPVPLTVAILMVKSLMRAAGDAVMVVLGCSWVAPPRGCAGGTGGSGDLGFPGLEAHGFVARLRPVQLRLLHVPGGGRAALGAQAAVHAQVLVLDHHAPGLRQAGRHVERLGEILRRR